MRAHKRLGSIPINATLIVLTVALLAQTGLYWTFARSEKVPMGRPLVQFPVKIGDWTMTQEGVVEPEVQAVLRADDALTRIYGNTKDNLSGHLFIAAFRSQRAGAAPHSPKNCLPGNGWVPMLQDIVHVSVPGRAEPMEINRYIVQHGDSKSLVLYWYQSRDRVVASEYNAKFYTMADAIRYNRTDTAIVKVTIPMSGADFQKQQASAEALIRDLYPMLRNFLPA